jgi:hypothetical protein
MTACPIPTLKASTDMSETKAKHTKGPWEIDLSVIHGNFVVGNKDGRPIVESFLCDDESAANARLIAAAPELLEALEALIGCQELNKFFDTRKLDLYGVHYICRFCRHRYIKPMVRCGNRDCPANKARAAIAKAKGEVSESNQHPKQREH